jgi:hypothetical protein
MRSGSRRRAAAAPSTEWDQLTACTEGSERTPPWNGLVVLLVVGLVLGAVAAGMVAMRPSAQGPREMEAGPLPSSDVGSPSSVDAGTPESEQPDQASTSLASAPSSSTSEHAPSSSTTAHVSSTSHSTSTEPRPSLSVPTTEAMTTTAVPTTVGPTTSTVVKRVPDLRIRYGQIGNDHAVLIDAIASGDVMQISFGDGTPDWVAHELYPCGRYFNYYPIPHEYTASGDYEITLRTHANGCVGSEQYADPAGYDWYTQSLVVTVSVSPG